MSDTAVLPRPREKTGEKEKTKRQPPYHVILLNDNDHTYEYVIHMLGALFGHNVEKAWLMACEVDSTGRVIVETTAKERAEFKRDQIHGFGADPLLPRCKGSMSAVIEPAAGGDDDDSGKE